MDNVWHSFEIDKQNNTAQGPKPPVYIEGRIVRLLSEGFCPFSIVANFPGVDRRPPWKKCRIPREVFLAAERSTNLSFHFVLRVIGYVESKEIQGNRRYSLKSKIFIAGKIQNYYQI